MKLIPAVFLILVIATSTAWIAYQAGYDDAKAECAPIRTKIPFKDMTPKQQVRYIKWFNRDREVIR